MPCVRTARRQTRILVRSTLRAPSALAGIFMIAGGGCYAHRAGRTSAAPAEDASIATAMIRIPAGRFTRGDLNGEPSEYPERTLQMAAFSIDRVEVSNRQYLRCVEAGSCSPTPYLEDPELGVPDRPVVGVSYFDAEKYCRWVGRRLPTEAEWEYAAKGTDHRRFPWVGPFDPAKANTQQPDPYPATAPVEALQTGDSPFGVRNMAGNAAEWVSDYFDPLYYRRSDSDRDPQGPGQGRARVVRGGSYRDSPYLVRVAARRGQNPTDIDNTVGLRCAQ